MSIHALIAAAYLEDLSPSTKLALMAIADSSDEQTRESAPGLPKVRAWSGLKRSQALAIVAELCHATDTRPRYLEHVAKGRVGRRAVYRVFPDGVPVIPRPEEVVARFERSSPPVEKSGEEGPADWTLPLEEGPISPVEGPAQTGPLHASTSVSSARDLSGPDQPATPSRASGFPGARPAAERPDPRTQPGYYTQPCPLHPDQPAGGCGRCAHAAVNSDPAKIAEAQARARADLAKVRGVVS